MQLHSHFEPLLDASIVFSGRMCFFSSLLLNCKLLDNRSCFCFPHLCIHCSASLYLVQNSCLAVLNKQNVYTHISLSGWQVTLNMSPALSRVLFHFMGWLTNSTKPSSFKLKFELFKLKLTCLSHIPSCFVNGTISLQN